MSRKQTTMYRDNPLYFVTPDDNVTTDLQLGERRAHVANKMFLQWCRDGLVLSFIFVQRLVSWDRTRLRKGTTAETQTLCVTLKPTPLNYTNNRL